MITPSNIRQKAGRKYNTYLKAWLSNTPFFPLEIRFAKIKPTADYMQIKNGLEILLAGSKATIGTGYSVTMKKRNTRRYGPQSFPTRIAFENESDFLGFIGKKREVSAFKRDVSLIRQTLPQLEDWLQQKPQRVITATGDWPDLMKVCQYFLDHPHPNCYLRELPIAIHTKFIEERKSIVRELLDELLPAGAIRTDASHFEQRFYLRYDESLVRFRLLDPTLQEQLGLPFTDASIPLSEFETLNWVGLPVVITENKINFLTLPSLPNAIGLWGGGFEVGILKKTGWLAHCPIFYWGDLDAQGFQILAQLRSAFPHVKSVLMDQVTFKAFSQFIGVGKPCSVETLSQLTPLEQQLFKQLLISNKRLEQEHISHSFAIQQLKQAFISLEKSE